MSDNKVENQTVFTQSATIGLILATFTVVFSAISLLFYAILLMIATFLPIIKILPFVLKAEIMVSCIMIVITWLSLLQRKEVVKLIPTHKIWMGALVPLSEKISTALGNPKDKATRSMIELHNEFVIKQVKESGSPLSKVLVLLPHCLQLDSCPLKITSDVRNCKSCGKCVIADFLKLSDKFSLDVFVSTGGTLARKAIKEKRPDAIIAVACERDLLSGIRDTLSMPVIGVLNQRPNGPCYNTTVDINIIESALKLIR